GRRRRVGSASRRARRGSLGRRRSRLAVDDEAVASEHTLRVTVNGQPRSVTVPANRLLMHLLRDDLGLTGTKEGCSVGVCGACSVLVDGVLVSSCLTPAIVVDG